VRKSNKRRVKRRTVKEQVRDAAVKGLPNPNEIATKIANSGAGPEEILGWLGSVLTRASRSGGVPTEIAEVEPELAAPTPPPTPAAVEEQLENNLLNTLLGEIKRNTRRKR